VVQVLRHDVFAEADAEREVQERVIGRLPGRVSPNQGRSGRHKQQDATGCLEPGESPERPHNRVDRARLGLNHLNPND
jgi:hypothetical protein